MQATSGTGFHTVQSFLASCLILETCRYLKKISLPNPDCIIIDVIVPHAISECLGIVTLWIPSDMNM